MHLQPQPIQRSGAFRWVCAALILAMLTTAARVHAGVWVQPIIEDSPMTKKGHLEGGVNGEAGHRTDGKTPLMLAVEAHQLDVIDYLLSHGADPSLKDAAGDTAMDIARRQKQKDAATMLDDYIGDHPNPAEYYAGETPAIAIVSGSSQTGTPDAGGPASLVVCVSGTDGEPMVDAPVRFAVEGGGQYLLTQASSPDSPSLLLRTNLYGCASANVHIPKTPGQRIRISATAGAGKRLSRVTFTAMAADDTHPSDGDSCFNPTDETAALNPDGSIDVTWVNHTDDETSIKVWVRMPGAWKLGAQVPPHSTKAHVPPP
jgi:hypothetical protein